MTALAKRILSANPDFSRRDRDIASFLAPLFWKQDNPSSNFREPPSAVYEAIESVMPEAREAFQAAAA
jgi:hypothetical protein